MTAFAACQLILDTVGPFGLLAIPFVITIPVLGLIKNECSN